MTDKEKELEKHIEVLMNFQPVNTYDYINRELPQNIIEMKRLFRDELSLAFASGQKDMVKRLQNAVSGDEDAMDSLQAIIIAADKSEDKE